MTDQPVRRQPFLRLAVVACCCGFFLLIALPWLGPQTRAPALLFLALIFAIAAVYELHMREIAEHWSLLALIAILLLAGMSWLVLDRAWPREADLRGPLIAAGDPTPPGLCPAPARGSLAMLVGNSRVLGKGAGPFTPARAGSCPVVTLVRKGAGLLVNAFGYNSANDMVYRVEDNQFHLVLDDELRSSRPDRSTFRVLDRDNREVLFVRYLNPGAVRVRGIFRCGGAPTVTILEDRVLVGRQPAAAPSCLRLDARNPSGITYGSGG